MAARRRSTRSRNDDPEDRLPPEPRHLTPNQAALRKAVEIFDEGRPSRFAVRVGFTRQAVYDWIGGRKDPNRKTVEKIELRLQTSLRAFFAPRLDAIYYRGATIEPGDPIHDRLTRAIRLEMRDAHPEIADTLDL